MICNFSCIETCNLLLIHLQVIQINKNPLTINLIATKTANTGQLANLENDLSVVVNDLAQAVVETWKKKQIRFDLLQFRLSENHGNFTIKKTCLFFQEVFCWCQYKTCRAYFRFYLPSHHISNVICRYSIASGVVRDMWSRMAAESTCLITLQHYALLNAFLVVPSERSQSVLHHVKTSFGSDLESPLNCRAPQVSVSSFMTASQSNLGFCYWSSS